ncbi:hypothetical protein ACIBJE_07785 [Micromonospora sp. NPDC050187]|uniref:hypothetical protein n=1 Tax=Micromonospora sp. NPDC050187 TaxID=3364277 RepID=UPI0037A54F48
MSDPDAYDLVFDQTGQQVDLQYNAEAIMVVNHIADGRSGKRCPRCNAAPMRQTSIVWDENTRRVDRGTMVLNYLALRVAPPRRPRERHHAFPLRSYLRGFGLLLGLSLVSTFFGRMGDIVMTLAIAGVVGLAIWAVRGYLRFRAAREADRQRWEKNTTRYRRDRDRWRQSWFCSACGAKAVERKPNHRQPAHSGSASTSQRGDAPSRRPARPRQRNRRPSGTD